MMKEFVKNNNTVYYNILPKLIEIYNNKYHSTIKMAPIEVNKNNKKYIKENIPRIVQESCVQCSIWIGSFNKLVKLSCCGYLCFGALTHFFRPNNKI